MDVPPFLLEPAGDGTAVLTAFSDDSPDPIRLRLDERAARALRDALDTATRMSSQGVDGPAARFVADNATVTVHAFADGSIRVNVQR